ncbi:MAG: TonB-dependent receptor [Luteibaculaceae bacterium]
MHFNTPCSKARLIAIALFFLCIHTVSFAQTQISGVVTDSQNKPLPGALVRIQNSLIGTFTVSNGAYNLRTNEKLPLVLEVSFLGFESQLLTIEQGGENINFSLVEKPFTTDEFVVTATRANRFTPVAKTTVDKEEINALNLGQDIPFILNFTPSIVVTSDAGAGVGYTGMRIRGSDLTRTNVTINGIPYNDAESQGVFFVNMPDFASSLNSIQIQRGVGASTNGAGAFGATINLETDIISEEAYAEVNNSFGSFNTRRHNIKFGTGKLDNKFAFEGRLSRLESDGFVDRAFSDMSSYYLAGGYFGDKITVKAIAFGGTQQVGQAWDGVPRSVLDTNRTFNFTGAIRDSDGNITGFYENETDNYRQDHYQLHVTTRLASNTTLNVSGHYTYGRGFFEQWRNNDRFDRHGLQPITIGGETINRTDLIRRRWLDNDFYGATFGLNHTTEKLNLIIGGGYHIYEGDHFGEVIWARFASQSTPTDNYYFNLGEKSDFNLYARANYFVNSKLDLYLDLQQRMVDYRVLGNDNSLRNIDVDESLSFFNPRAGIGYQLSKNDRFFTSFSVAGREPNRRDFVDNPDNFDLKPETLYNLEMGYNRSAANYLLNVNFFYMYYLNQLVHSGSINDVGAFVRTNSGESFRTGIEIDATVKFNNKIFWRPNFTYSVNQHIQFTDTRGGEVVEFGNTDISFSPSIVGGSQLIFLPIEKLQVVFLSKYVGEQFLDNTGSDAALLEAFFVQDFRIAYEVKTKFAKRVEFNILVNNIFNRKFASNGYMFGETQFLFPQAGTNFLAGLNVRF